MSESQSLLAVLRQSADGACVDALERLVADGADWRLNRINALAFARREGLDEERTISTFLKASQVGLLDLSWNVLCPSCGGVLDANTSLKSVRASDYYCAFCNLNSEPTLDDMVEVSFTVNPRVRRIAGHAADDLPLWEYYRQVFWGTGVDLPEDDFESMQETLDLASRAHAAFPHWAAIGWDIAIVDDGPVVIEGNSGADLDIIQRSHREPMGDSRFGKLLAYHLEQLEREV